MDLKDKVAVITGAGQGIGKATAIALAQAGASVIVADINYDQVQVVADQLTVTYNSNVMASRVDVSNNTNVVEMFGAIYARYGKIDILVNNAGIAQSATPFEQITDEDWDRVLNVNLKGMINCCRAVIPYFKQQKYGKIINMASLAGEVGGIAVAPTYSVSKAAVICLTKCLAKYLGPYQVTVNSVSPGYIKTPMTADLGHESRIDTVPLKRLGEAEEVADAIVFLASDRSRYITGDTLDVNGGVYMK
jgi:3-oxoacyl-[acyl-carrier protein] reductase